MELLEQLGLVWIIFGLMLIPYFCWGVYLLKMRFQHQTELSVAGEALTFLGLIIFLVLEFAFLNLWLSDSPLIFILAVLGLLTSLLALYGPMLMSLASHILVDAVMPSGTPLSHEPKYGAAEGFEQKGDYEAAAREYMAIARMFPKEAKASLRAGDNLMKLDRPDEAVLWLKRGLNCLSEAEESLPIVNRIGEVYLRHLDKPEQAIEIFENYLARFPDAEYADSVKRRLAKLKGSHAFLANQEPSSSSSTDPSKSLLADGPSYLPDD
ncbi:MAG: tetratricopeptide repeat protein [Candidatus Hydrogenedentota bacterium]